MLIDNRISVSEVPRGTKMKRGSDKEKEYLLH